jgi:hypothetical protein
LERWDSYLWGETEREVGAKERKRKRQKTAHRFSGRHISFSQTNKTKAKAMSRASLLSLANARKWYEMRSLLQRGSGFGNVNEKDGVRF